MNQSLPEHGRIGACVQEDGSDQQLGSAQQQLSSALPHMTLADSVQVLTVVGQATPADQALLSSLVAVGDPEMPGKSPKPYTGADLQNLLVNAMYSPADFWSALADDPIASAAVASHPG
ncbi:hypothetical protein [Streptomyces sp. NPDC005859]|uniref:hypothetical protein n=1 Tax=Streptomyces sp. NPDC005859 TaxID=3157170 RepID=UPI003401D790